MRIPVVILLCISVYFCSAFALTDNFALWAVFPFFVFLIIYLIKSEIPYILRVLLLTFVSTCLSLVYVEREKNKFIYPYAGKEQVIKRQLKHLPQGTTVRTELQLVQDRLYYKIEKLSSSPLIQNSYPIYMGSNDTDSHSIKLAEDKLKVDPATKEMTFNGSDYGEIAKSFFEGYDEESAKEVQASMSRFYLYFPVLIYLLFLPVFLINLYKFYFLNKKPEVQKSTDPGFVTMGEKKLSMRDKLAKVSFIGSYFLAYSYVLAAAINDGYTSYYLGIPFVLFLLVDTSHPNTSKKLRNANLIFLIFAALLHIMDRSSYTIFHPLIGSHATVKKDVIVNHHHHLPYQIEFNNQDKRTPQPQYTLKKGTRFTYTNSYMRDGGGLIPINSMFKVRSSDVVFEKEFLQNAKNKAVYVGDLDESLQNVKLDSLFIDLDRESKKYFLDSEVGVWRMILATLPAYLFGLLIIFFYIPLLMVFAVLAAVYINEKEKRDTKGSLP